MKRQFLCLEFTGVKLDPVRLDNRPNVTFVGKLGGSVPEEEEEEEEEANQSH